MVSQLWVCCETVFTLAGCAVPTTRVPWEGAPGSLEGARWGEGGNRVFHTRVITKLFKLDALVCHLTGWWSVVRPRCKVRTNPEP